MLRYYQLSHGNDWNLVEPTAANWLVLARPTEAERQSVIDEYDLPEELFVARDETEKISRYEQIDSSKLGSAVILSLTNVTVNNKKSVEERLEPLILIWSTNFVITYVGDNSEFVEQLIDRYGSQATNTERLCAYVILMVYSGYIKELIEVKNTIDHLDQAARRTTKNEELFRLADTERNIVYLDHILRGQKKTLNRWWHRTKFTSELDNAKLLYDIKLRQAHAEELIVIYRDLLETVGGLFNDMMDNKLNNLMKYLNSVALIISIPTLIAGVWGMNTGGLPGETTEIGFWSVIFLSVVATILMAWHLKRKDYTK